MEFSRPEYWSGYPFPSARDLLSPRIKPKSPTLQMVSLPAEAQGKSTAVYSKSQMGSLSRKINHLPFGQTKLQPILSIQML